MSSEQIRAALQQVHSVRGRLSTICKTHDLNYYTLLKFMATPGRQLEHDTALAVIKALPAEFKQTQPEAA